MQLTVEPSTQSQDNLSNLRAGQRLPIELLVHIIEDVVPSNPNAILSSSHISTKTLLSLTRVSRSTYLTATRLLRLRCMHLASFRQLAELTLCMSRLVPSLPPGFSLANITSLYLRPFGPKLDEIPTAKLVKSLFVEVSQSLKKLIIEMPFGTLDTADDHYGVKLTLRDGFNQLSELEEFVAIGEYPELSLPEWQTDVWRLFPCLKRLALFHVPMSSHWLWWNIATLNNLQHVIFAQCRHLSGSNIKEKYFHTLPSDEPALKKRLKVMLMDSAYETEDVSTVRWKQIDAEERLTVETYSVPLPFYGDESTQQLVTDWVRRCALDGTLWDLDGEKVKQG